MFVELVTRGAPLTELASAADGLGTEGRRELLGTLPRRLLARLYALAATDSVTPAKLSFFVPTNVGTQGAVDWWGRNSLPLAFNRFTRRFTRGDRSDELVGHNDNGATVNALIGPGYFLVSRRDDAPAEFLFDYTRSPERAPPGWPPVKNNLSGPGRFVFGGLKDYFRPIGHSLGIGASYNAAGKFAGTYFLLARAG